MNSSLLVLAALNYLFLCFALISVFFCLLFIHHTSDFPNTMLSAKLGSLMIVFLFGKIHDCTFNLNVHIELFQKKTDRHNYEENMVGESLFKEKLGCSVSDVFE